MKHFEQSKNLSIIELQEIFIQNKKYQKSIHSLNILFDEIIVDSEGNVIDAEPEINKDKAILWTDIITEDDLKKACSKLNQTKILFSIKKNEKNIWEIYQNQKK